LHRLLPALIVLAMRADKMIRRTILQVQENRSIAFLAGENVQ